MTRLVDKAISRDPDNRRVQANRFIGLALDGEKVWEVCIACRGRERGGGENKRNFGELLL